MRSARELPLLCAALALLACGSDESSTATSDDDWKAAAAANAGSATSEGPKIEATAEEVAEEARGDVDCPADIATPARAEGAPVDDIVGVRPGLTLEEAQNLVLCTHDLLVAAVDTSRGFKIQTYGQTLRQGFSARFAQAKEEYDPRRYMENSAAEVIARGGLAATSNVRPGESEWFVTTMGAPGDERVIAAARQEWFAEGRSPTMASVEQALIEKYGAPNANQAAGQRYMRWSYDPMGRPITETSPLLSQCTASSSPGGGSGFSPDCGIVIAARITPLKSNPELAQEYEVGIVDQAGGFARITATEQALAQQDAQRRASEVEEAQENADAPNL